MNKEQALRAIQNGIVAACISGGLILLIIFYSMLLNDEENSPIWSDPSYLIGIAFTFLCAFGIYKKSRTAAIALLVYYVAEKVLLIYTTGNYSGIFIALIFIFFFAKAIQGTFVYHKLVESEKLN